MARKSNQASKKSPSAPKKLKSKLSSETASLGAAIPYSVLVKYTLLLAVCFGVIFMVAFWVMVAARPIHVLANFRDQELMTTLKWLQERELKPIVYEKLDSEVEQHRIIAQNPEPGMFVKEGRAITLIVSGGTELEVMRDFVGMEFSTVKKQIYTQLTGAKTIPRVVKIERYSTTYAEGVVSDQFPQPDERIDLEKDIVFFVSRGIVENTIQVQDYRMRSYQKVAQALSAQDINVQPQFVAVAEERYIGLVFAQDKTPGSTLLPGSSLNLTVAVARDEDIEAATPATSQERLRVLSMRVPYPVTPLREVNRSLEDELIADQDKLLLCPCLADAPIYPDSLVDEDSVPVEDDLPAQDEVVFRTVTLVINDVIRKDQETVYKDILAGRKITLPYRTMGAGSLSIYIDDQFYRSEYFSN